MRLAYILELDLLVLVLVNGNVYVPRSWLLECVVVLIFSIFLSSIDILIRIKLLMNSPHPPTPKKEKKSYVHIQEEERKVCFIFNSNLHAHHKD